METSTEGRYQTELSNPPSFADHPASGQDLQRSVENHAARAPETTRHVQCTAVANVRKHISFR
eukprot:5483159-Karenia_brevis.AAC.1